MGLMVQWLSIGQGCCNSITQYPMLLLATTPSHRSTTQLQVTKKLKPQNTTPQKRRERASTTLPLTLLPVTTPRLQLTTQLPMQPQPTTLRLPSTINRENCVVHQAR
ncbi:hypothetical protein OUZ56_015109 [Daphnia magna]|uniref:Uncharacterized protein n=1 Tax=Daphnia magna TaxID=35525 RepID=A0ABR0ALT9_9CRUS|nr:hypothetical protein OUZ56_015109 [Daphnia magna]